MNKEFIPYKEALALKELGFDEPCIAFGYIYGEEQQSRFMISTSTNKNSDWSTDLSKTFISIPTYSQAFRWFREKHNLHHDIGVIGDWDKPQYKYIVYGKTMNNPAHMWYYETANSYEEAELACLRKLIELVKSKQLTDDEN